MPCVGNRFCLWLKRTLGLPVAQKGPSFIDFTLQVPHAEHVADNGDKDGEAFVPEVDEDEENENGGGATKSATRDSKRPARRETEKPAPDVQTGMSNAAQPPTFY